MMGLALRVARRMLGQTAPNPAVGAVIANETTGEVVARGWTQISGRPHAEAHALSLAGEAARGRTMYVTLEPCSYHGRSNPVVSKAMPCAEAILAAGMRRVVVATEDPNPEIAGQGVAVLRRAGVTVDIGTCGREARWVTAGHILRMTRGRPFVQLKVAVAGDGLIAPGDGAPVWVTGPVVRAYAHVLRARVDAVLVGRRTVDDDDPELTCRLPGLANRSPRRVLLDSRFRIAPPRKMFATIRRVPILIFGAIGSTPPAYPSGVEARQVAAGPDGRLDLDAVLRSLGREGVTRVLVEGGPTISAALLAADLVDEVVIARGTEALGGGGRRPFGDRGLELLDDRARWQLAERRMLGPDALTIHRRVGRL
ncbi:MAG: bifunctional diaminohydroxyphosphoribosylaminopyrimidine deaminase/5-amino-6-(5-phosphoribosylamino)uracil reductase RibD [Hyphomicrobiaceae bacterium]|nr:bifunctional diaminohydroxyphosphoribosylaminopyrimidine deaminase/5-amino-6-(5-phosphoribosylamino)uracil reductase RibD [Hyphomicrobiaceae bacterium]